MKKAQVPVVPGYEGEILSYDHAMDIAKNIGFPLMIKGLPEVEVRE